MSASLRNDLGASRAFIKAFGFKVFFKKAVNATCVRPFRRYAKGSYSQDLEDLIIDRLLGHKKNGFYIDIGTNDPIRSNNTMRFYKQGWEGINIEPSTSCYGKITVKRPRDVNLNIGISRESGKRTFYSFLPDTRSTFSQATAERLVREGFKLVERKEIEMLPLSSVLDRYCGGRTLDLMSVDTEGFDEQVLLSNDWERHKPTIICIELSEDETIHRILTGHGYTKMASTADNAIYDLRDG